VSASCVLSDVRGPLMSVMLPLQRWPAFDSWLPFIPRFYLRIQSPLIKVRLCQSGNLQCPVNVVYLLPLFASYFYHFRPFLKRTQPRHKLRAKAQSKERWLRPLGKTFVVRTPDNQFRSTDRRTNRRPFPWASIRVESRPSGDTSTRLAIRVISR
jgi:hypothetical protein